MAVAIVVCEQKKRTRKDISMQYLAVFNGDPKDFCVDYTPESKQRTAVDESALKEIEDRFVGSEGDGHWFLCLPKNHHD